MTDNEIIKAFKDFLNEQIDGYTDHVETGGERYEFIEKELELLKETDNLINRQKAEIERLKSDVSVSRDAYMSMKDRYEYEKEKVEKAKQKCIDIGKALKTAKAEAYKEFAEKVSKLICDNTYPDFDKDGKAVNIWNAKDGYKQIDNLLKEMESDNNA